MKASSISAIFITRCGCTRTLEVPLPLPSSVQLGLRRVPQYEDMFSSKLEQVDYMKSSGWIDRRIFDYTGDWHAAEPGLSGKVPVYRESVEQ